MGNLYNEIVFWSFMGGAFSWILTVVVLFIKQTQKRDTGRSLFQERYNNNPEIGDIETKLDESLEYKKPIVSEILAVSGLQPLYIIAVAGLIVHASRIEIVEVFFLSLLLFLHELVWERKYSKTKWYLLLVITLWILVYIISTLQANKKDAITINNITREQRNIDSVNNRDTARH